MRILVADDEPTIHEMLGQLLPAAGYEVLHATNGNQAILLARDAHPDLIVLDLVMPETTGLEVVGKLKNDPDLMDIPILIMSGINPGDGLHASLRESGITEFISKDDLVTSLLSRVQEILSKQAHQVA